MCCDSWKSCPSSFRVVGGFETLTAMENVESDPKTDRPKVCVKPRGLCRRERARVSGVALRLAPLALLRKPDLGEVAELNQQIDLLFSSAPRRKYELRQQLFLLIHTKRQMHR